MIQTTDGQAILQLMEKVRRRPGDYRRIVISSPFIDGFGLIELERLAGKLERGTSAVVDLVVRRPVADLLRERIEESSRLRLHVRDDLHAKVYVLLGVNPMANEGLITSSNLTEAGINRNIEVGVRMRGADPRITRELDKAVHRVTYSKRRIR